MGEISILIIIVLTLYVGIGVIDQISLQSGFYSPLFAAAFTGFVMGDLNTGLIVGATMQLLTLGVATYGGASIPDYLSGAVMGTAYAILSGLGAEYGIGLAVPIGLLLTQLDVFGRMSNIVFQKMAERAAEKGDYRGVERANILGSLSWMLSRMLPVCIGLLFGETVVNGINAFIPVYIMNGLKAAGQLLPAVGMAILLRYLPIKKYYPYMIMGFVLIAYGAQMFTLLAVALIGFACAALYMKQQQDQPKVATTYENDEVEIDG